VGAEEGARVGKVGGSTWIFVQGPPEFLVTPLIVVQNCKKSLKLVADTP